MAMSTATQMMRLHARRSSAFCLLRSSRPDPNLPLLPQLQGLGSSCRWYRGATAAVGPPSTPVNLGVSIVPERKVFVVERLGMYHKTLSSGIHFLVPGVIQIPGNTATTKDDALIQIGGVLHVKNPIYAVTHLAEFVARSEICKITLDKTFKERDTLNHNIMKSINYASCEWGVKCLKYDICRTVHPALARCQAHHPDHKTRPPPVEVDFERILLCEILLSGYLPGFDPQQLLEVHLEELGAPSCVYLPLAH
ncbi:hypothetical protein VPH35_017399 [Triticum aestivum]